MSGIKRWLKKLYAYVRCDRKAIAYQMYIDAGGESLRLDYPLEEDSIVIDAGGYVGDFAADVTKKFDCRVDIFEPVTEYAKKIRGRFSFNNKVRVIQAGLGAEEKEEFINIEGLGSSVFGDHIEEAPKEKVKIVSAVDYIESNGYLTIDLMKINIEGGEYELLFSLIEHPELINNIKYFQIQFHDFVPDSQDMRTQVHKQLSKTHKLMWNYPFIWESWERKSR
jgi:FkbM family methyltransferase